MEGDSLSASGAAATLPQHRNTWHEIALACPAPSGPGRLLGPSWCDTDILDRGPHCCGMGPLLVNGRMLVWLLWECMFRMLGERILHLLFQNLLFLGV